MSSDTKDIKISDAQAEAINARRDLLLTSPHIHEQAKRLYPVLVLVGGTRDSRTEYEVIAELATLTALMDIRTDIDHTADNGGIMLVRQQFNSQFNSLGGRYAIFVRSAAIEPLALPLIHDRDRPKEESS